MSDELQIKVTIDNRVYPLTIHRSEEETIRKAAKVVNDNIRELENSYAVRDRQDLLAMTALFFANKSVENVNNNDEAMNALAEELDNMNKRLSQYLADK
jgi:cell division protein ZapA